MSEAGTAQLHFLVNVGGSGYHRVAWRRPGHDPAEYLDIKHFQRAAKLAEAALLDGLLFPDIPVWMEAAGTGPTPALEPTLVATAIAAVTSRIGLIPTLSTSVGDPYNLARRVLSLDHASGGRAAWNAVTTFEKRALHNAGIAELPTREARYRRAAEFVEVVERLWDSWEDGALIGDQDTARFADPALVHAIDHVGEHFTVAGPLNVVRSPQGRPVLAQAGASASGEEFAARVAEVIYGAQLSLTAATEFTARIRSRATELGRDPGAIRVLPGLVPIIGDSTEHAQRRLADLNAQLTPYLTPLQQVSSWLGIPIGDLNASEPITAEQVRKAGAEEAAGPQGFVDAGLRFALESGLPAAELVNHVLGGHRVVAGTAESIADHIESWWRAGAVDGFTIVPAELPTSLAEFAEQVLPILRERGIFRSEYEGTTLRDSLGLPVPENSFAVGRSL